jgi:Acyl-coenzyme A:6-aminopenicillanic acid acyl-transferase
MSFESRRSYHFKGTPREIGVAMGQALGERLEQNISQYIKRRPSGTETLDLNHLCQGAMSYLRSLPERFQDELEGMALGARLPLQRIAEWIFVEKCIEGSCSGFICRINGHTWVGRNNDLNVPELWGFLTVREVEGRIPTISFGMEGDIFTPTGINREKLWLHYNYLPAVDAPSGEKPALPGYILIPEALETCTTIQELETLLNITDRDGGMMLFAVDGKTEESAIFECNGCTYKKRNLTKDWIAGTNHYFTMEAVEHSQSSSDRYARLEALLKTLYAFKRSSIRWEDLAEILADDGIEGREEDYGTVYANVACPALGNVWYTFGGYPAASAGNWREVQWPW